MAAPSFARMIAEPGVAVSETGMVAAPHPLASKVAVDVLERGGTAVDAAVAAAGVLAVVQPPMNGLGGDAFLLHHSGEDGTITAVNGSGRVGERATPGYLASLGHDELMPLSGIAAAAVPGAVGTYLTALQRWGGLPLKELWAPAVRLARRGVPLNAKAARWVDTDFAELERLNGDGNVFGRAGSRAVLGSVVAFPELAGSLEAIAEAGASEGVDLFYRGWLGRAIGEFVEESGGLFGAGDMFEHQTEVYRPLSTGYREARVFTTAPPSQGVITLEMLRLLEGFDVAAMKFGDALHLMVEVKKLAFEDRNRHLADPRHGDFEAEALLADSYIERRRGDLDLRSASTRDPGGQRSGSDTTFLAVADRWGNGVSLITSLSGSFGCKVTVPGTGIMLNNRAGRGFSLDASHPNVIAPFKRTMHTLNCYIVRLDDGTLLLGGTPGGDKQPQINVQTISGLIDHRQSLRATTLQPRWYHFPGSDPHTLADEPELHLERPGDEQAIAELRERGHRVKLLPRLGAVGDVQLVAMDRRSGLFAGISDPRGDGCALGPVFQDS